MNRISLMHSVLRVKIFLFSKTRFGLFDLPEHDYQVDSWTVPVNWLILLQYTLKIPDSVSQIRRLVVASKEEVVTFQVQLFIKGASLWREVFIIHD